MSEKTTPPAGAKYQVDIDVDEAGTVKKTFFLRGLNRRELGMILQMIMPAHGQPDYVRAGETIINNALVEGGDWEEIKADEDLYTSACFGAYQVVDIKTTTVKKL